MFAKIEILLPCKRKIRTRLTRDTFREDGGMRGERKTSVLVLGENVEIFFRNV